MVLADVPAPATAGWLTAWENSAIAAMQAEPLYFARWYTVKSIALALSFGMIGYLLLKEKK